MITECEFLAANSLTKLSADSRKTSVSQLISSGQKLSHTIPSQTPLNLLKIGMYGERLDGP